MREHESRRESSDNVRVTADIPAKRFQSWMIWAAITASAFLSSGGGAYLAHSVYKAAPVPDGNVGLQSLSRDEIQQHWETLDRNAQTQATVTMDLKEAVDKLSAVVSVGSQNQSTLSQSQVRTATQLESVVGRLTTLEANLREDEKQFRNNSHP